MIKSHKQLIVKKFKKISNNHNKVLKSQHTSRSKKKKKSQHTNINIWKSNTKILYLERRKVKLFYMHMLHRYSSNSPKN